MKFASLEYYTYNSSMSVAGTKTAGLVGSCYIKITDGPPPAALSKNHAGF